MRTQGNCMPDAKVCHFELNPETGWYVQTNCPLGFIKIPSELRVEETRRPDKINSEFVIHSRKKDGRYLFFTGLLPARMPGLFFGDFYEVQRGKKKNSFCLFSFTEANRRLAIHFFNGFKLYPNRREWFIADYWRKVSK